MLLLCITLDFAGILPTMKSPLGWLSGLPAPKTASAAIERLESMEAADVALNLLCADVAEEDEESIDRRIIERRRWDDTDLNDVIDRHKRDFGKQHRMDKKAIATWFDWLAQPEEFGNRYVDGISEYYENFFREEEKRIAPRLLEGLEHAQRLADDMSQSELLEELSQGIKSDTLMDHEVMLLIPSFWLSPFVMVGSLNKSTGFMQFGARPHDASLIPGDAVPDSLSTGLQALSDHTRLKILRLIAAKPLTQVEISKKLRLRAPTISHHLKTLRMASLVTKTIGDEDPGNTRYSIRSGRVDELCDSIRGFLS
jgi:DNA-binding transcriptional ArsR family regulator